MKSFQLGILMRKPGHGDAFRRMPTRLGVVGHMFMGRNCRAHPGLLDTLCQTGPRL